MSALLFNPQTESAATEQIRDAAPQASLPVVTVTETLPAGVDYLTWQRDTVDDLAAQFDEAATRRIDSDVIADADVVVELAGGRLAFGDRVLWDHLDLAVRAGEFIAVLGPNGTGKTSLLKVLLGQLPLSAGTVTVAGKPVTEGSDLIGYVPQHRSVDRGLTLRGSDLVGLGLDGHRWGVTSLRPAERSRRRAAVQAALRPGQRRPRWPPCPSA